MTQGILVAIIISAAIAFLGVRAYKAWSGKKAPGCDKCGTPTPERKP